eukprot:9932416-Lingulodinium_polyedra.AAC.1
MNCWREFAAVVFFVWKTIDVDAALKYGQNMPPRCIGERWGSKDICEERLLSILDAGKWEQFTNAMRTALDKRTRAAAKAASDRNNPDPLGAALELCMDLDDVARHARQHYHETMAAWCRDALQALDTDCFVAMLRISFLASGPLRSLR